MRKIETPDWRDLDVPSKRLAEFEAASDRFVDVDRSRGATYGELEREFAYPDGYDMSWYDDGACKGIDPNLMMPMRAKGNQVATNIDEAKKLACGGCVVKAMCLDYALDIYPEARGVWGDTSENERRKIKSERNKIKKNAA